MGQQWFIKEIVIITSRVQSGSKFHDDRINKYLHNVKDYKFLGNVNSIEKALKCRLSRGLHNPGIVVHQDGKLQLKVWFC